MIATKLSYFLSLRMVRGFARNTGKNKRIVKFEDILSKKDEMGIEANKEEEIKDEIKIDLDEMREFDRGEKPSERITNVNPVLKLGSHLKQTKPKISKRQEAKPESINGEEDFKLDEKDYLRHVVEKVKNEKKSSETKGLITDINFEESERDSVQYKEMKPNQIQKSSNQNLKSLDRSNNHLLNNREDGSFVKVGNTLTKEEIANIDISVVHKPERVSKYLSRSSVCSRRQAEKMIENGMVRVNGRKILSNVEIDSLKDEVSIFTKKGEYFPMKESTRIWIFYKPVGMICTHKDPHNRPTIFEHIKKSGIIKEEFVMSVGRLDYNSEGLMILTNDGELARILELPLNKIQRSYRVRVYGRFSEERLVKIREGAVIKGVRYGPFWCNVDSYQTRNTWLLIKMTQGKNNEIRRIMRKNSLRVNRLKRLTYGPYSLGNLAAGEIREAEVEDEIKRLMYLNKRAVLKQHEQTKDSEKDIKEKVVKSLEGRLKDPLPLLKRSRETAKAIEASVTIESNN